MDLRTWPQSLHCTSTSMTFSGIEAALCFWMAVNNMYLNFQWTVLWSPISICYILYVNFQVTSHNYSTLGKPDCQWRLRHRTHWIPQPSPSLFSFLPSHLTEEVHSSWSISSDHCACRIHSCHSLYILPNSVPHAPWLSWSDPWTSKHFYILSAPVMLACLTSHAFSASYSNQLIYTFFFLLFSYFCLRQLVKHSSTSIL